MTRSAANRQVAAYRELRNELFEESIAMTERASSGAAWLSTLPLLTAAQRHEVVSVFRRVLAESPLPTVLTETGEGRILGCNEQFAVMLGAHETVLHAQRVEELVHPDDRHKTSAVLGRLRSGESTLEDYEARWVRPDGRVVWTRRHVLRIDGPAEEGTVSIVGVLEDLTPLRLAQELAAALVDIGTGIAAGASLEETVERLTRLAEARWSQVGTLLTILDPKRNVLIPICPNARDSFVADLPDLPVGPAGGACGQAAWRDEPTAMANLLDDSRVEQLHPIFARHGVSSSWAVPLHDADGQVIGTLGAFHPFRCEPTQDDWSALASVAGVAAIAIVAEHRRRSASQEQQRVRTDPRTGLLNDVALIEQVDAMLAQRAPVTVAVATLRGPGKLASIESLAKLALTTLATRASSLGQVPFVAAIGVTSLALVARANWNEREAKLLHRVLARPMDFGTTVIRPEVAVGVASPSPDEIVTAAELLARATLAVPAHGGSSVVQPQATGTAQAHGLAGDLARAFRQREFVVYYQPQFDLITGNPAGAEALVRWQHPQLGLLGPGEFLPTVECIGATTELAFGMIRRVAADRSHRIGVGITGNIAVNLAADDLLNESFMHVLRDPEERLWQQVSLELTEAQFVRPEAVLALEELAALGYTIALDDFGTGYSALSAIHTLPLSVVKIDRSFVERLPHDASAEALVAAISALCEQLAITVVAEGIETEAQARAVRDLGCRLGQGYLLGRPRPLEAYAAEPLKPWEARPGPHRQRPVLQIGDAARQRVLDLHHKGASLATIAAALNRSGYRATGGTRWQARSVLTILSDQQHREG